MKVSRILTFIIFFLYPCLIYSQTQDTEDTIAYEDNYNSFMLNLSYTNNNLENISGSIEKMPTLFTNLSFFHKTGFYTGIAYAGYYGDNNKAYDYDIEFGFQKFFNNGFDIDLNYNWHQYSGDTILEGFNYDHSLNLSSGVDIGKFYLNSDVSYYIGTTSNLSLDINFSRFISINKIFSQFDALYINPTISVSFGTDYWMYEDMAASEKNALFADLKNAGYSYETFSYESFNIFIPISYGIKNTYITFSWIYKIPGAKYEYLGWENQSGFMFSLSYFLNL
jgi:hypothetical protein